MLAETGRATGVIVCPQGFTADHLEVAYDLDTLAADIAAELGLGFVRTPTIGADPATMTAIAQRIVASAQELQAT
jgi:ferrochelatase